MSVLTIQEQVVLLIHNTVSSLKSLCIYKLSSVHRRIIIGSLNDINLLSIKFFDSNGADAEDTIDEISEIEQTIQRIRRIYDDKPSYDDSNTKIHQFCNIADDDLFYIMSCSGASKATALLNIVDYINRLQSQYAFQKLLHDEKVSIAAVTRCEVEQFTYGTSSLSLWIKLCSDASFHKAISSSSNNNNNSSSSSCSSRNKKIVIFGSSVGLLCFYTSCLVDCKCDIVGYEILPCLHDVAIRQLENHKNTIGSNITFHLQDMNQANVSDADVVILTSICWDKETKEKIAYKLAKEMDISTSIVVDYSDCTFSPYGLDYDGNFYTSKKIQKQHAPSSTRITLPEIDMSNINETIPRLSISELEELLLHSITSIKINADSSNNDKQNRIFHITSIVDGPCSWNDSQYLYIYS